MKRLILFLTILFGLNLNGMEEQNSFSDSETSVIINSYTHSDDESFVTDSDDESAENSENEENIGIDSLYVLFDRALIQGKSEIACNVLRYMVETYSNTLNDSQINYIDFVITFLTAITLDNDIIASANSTMSEKSFQVLSNTFNQTIAELQDSINQNKIELDEVNASTCYGFNTCLMKLVLDLADSIMMLKFLLDHGLNINIADEMGNTPLHLLANLPGNKENENMIRCLLEHNADLEAVNHIGQTPLHCVINENCINVMALMYLTRNNANINAKDNQGNTLLNLLCKLDETKISIAMVRFLMHNKADSKIKNDQGLNAHIIAELNNNTTIVKILNIESKRAPEVKFSTSKTKYQIDSPDLLRRYAIANNQQNLAF